VCLFERNVVGVTVRCDSFSGLLDCQSMRISVSENGLGDNCVLVGLRWFSIKMFYSRIAYQNHCRYEILYIIYLIGKYSTIPSFLLFFSFFILFIQTKSNVSNFPNLKII
jgi:hypothetical protein